MIIKGFDRVKNHHIVYKYDVWVPIWANDNAETHGEYAVIYECNRNDKLLLLVIKRKENSVEIFLTEGGKNKTIKQGKINVLDYSSPKAFSVSVMHWLEGKLSASV